MNEYVLISDSTADLPVEVISKFNIDIVPFSYSIEDVVTEYTLTEGEDAVAEFYNKLRHGAMPVTSQINPYIYKDFFEKYIKEGKDILYLCFSSGLSGSYQTAGVAAGMLKEKYPDARISIIDSRCASVGQGVLLYLAMQKKAQGMSFDELEAWILDNKGDVSHWFMVEDLFHLKRGGRVNTVEAMVGTMLKIKPILSVDEEGKLVVKSKARGVNKALEYIIERLKEEAKDLSALTAVIGHADSMEKAKKLKEMAVEAGMKEENILIAPIGPIIGTHVGAGMAAIAFLR